MTTFPSPSKVLSRRAVGVVPCERKLMATTGSGRNYSVACVNDYVINAVLATCEICDDLSVAVKAVVERAVGLEACESKVNYTSRVAA